MTPKLGACLVVVVCQVRKTMIAAILATEMAKHNHMIDELSTKAVAFRGTLLPPSTHRTRATRSLPPVRVGRVDVAAAVVVRRAGGPKRQPRPRSHSKPPTMLRKNLSDQVRPAPPKALRMTRARSTDTTALPFSIGSAADRQLLVCAIVHTCDLSGQAYGEAVSNEWSDRIVQEFSAQAQRESDEGLPVSGFMANLDTPMAIAKLQFGFIAFVVIPLWQSLGKVLKGLDVRCGSCGCCGCGGCGNSSLF